MANIEDAALVHLILQHNYTSSPADNADGITWLDGTAPISKVDLEAKKAELQTARRYSSSTKSNR